MCKPMPCQIILEKRPEAQPPLVSEPTGTHVSSLGFCDGRVGHSAAQQHFVDSRPSNDVRLRVLQAIRFAAGSKTCRAGQERWTGFISGQFQPCERAMITEVRARSCPDDRELAK